MDLAEQDAYLLCMDDNACAFEDDWDYIFEEMVLFYHLDYESKSE